MSNHADERDRDFLRLSPDIINVEGGRGEDIGLVRETIA
jgi:hypothetical protein